MECAPAVAPPWFRVSVDLRRYFSDVRARVLLLVPAGAAAGSRRVEWVSRRLRRRLGAALGGPHALMLAGCALPPREPLALLQPGDEITVIPLEKDCFPNLDDEVSDIEDKEIFQPKRKISIPSSFTDNTVNLSHARKRKHTAAKHRNVALNMQESKETSAESTMERDYVEGASQLQLVKLRALSLLEAATVPAEVETKSGSYEQPCDPVNVEPNEPLETWRHNGAAGDMSQEPSPSQPRAARRRRVRRRPRRDPDPDPAASTGPALELEETSDGSATTGARRGRLVRALAQVAGGGGGVQNQAGV